MGRSITPDQTAVTLLDGVGADMGPFEGSKVRLLQGDIILTRTTTIEECVAAEADYTGYPVGGIAIAEWLAAGVDEFGFPVLAAPTVQFASTGVALANSITGYFVVNTAGTGLRFMAYLDTPVAMGASGLEVLNLEVEFTWGT